MQFVFGVLALLIQTRSNYAYNWLAQIVYAATDCRSNTISYVLLSQTDHCFQTSSKSSQLTTCTNTTKGYVVKNVTTYSQSASCSGKSITVTTKFSTSCLGSVTYNCYENPIYETWPGIGIWNGGNKNEPDGCPVGYGPLVIETSPPTCQSNGLTGSALTSCSDSKIYYNSYLTPNCTGKPSSVLEYDTNSCQSFSATSVPGTNGYPACQLDS